MRREGPIKHCFCCNRPMMKQVMKCSMCGSEQLPKRKAPDQTEALRVKHLVLGSVAAMFIPASAA